MAKIRHLFHISASPKEVFDAISTIENLQKWWTTETSGSSDVGGVIDFRFGTRGFIQVKVDELISGEKITWTCTDGDPQWHDTRITFHLSWNEEAKACKVNFIHDGWAEETEFMGVCCFSWAKYFMGLKAICEGGNGEPYTE